MRRFAKLFDFGAEGQLLVQRSYSDEPELDNAPYLIEIKTRNDVGVTMEIKPGFRSEKSRDAAFDKFEESNALFQFTAMQESLAKMSNTK